MQQLQSLRDITIYRCSDKLKRGKPVDWTGERFFMKTIPQIRDEVFAEIINLGFSNIERVRNLEQANCIVRTYLKRNYSYTDFRSDKFNMYGAKCFVKNSANEWMTIVDDDHEVRYSEHQCLLQHWFSPFRNKLIECEYFDFYIQVS